MASSAKARTGIAAILKAHSPKVVRTLSPFRSFPLNPSDEPYTKLAFELSGQDIDNGLFFLCVKGEARHSVQDTKGVGGPGGIIKHDRIGPDKTGFTTCINRKIFFVGIYCELQPVPVLIRNSDTFQIVAINTIHIDGRQFNAPHI